MMDASDPGRDVVRVDQVDVTTPDNQSYLDGLALRLCAFQPTAILVEHVPEQMAAVQQPFEYLSGSGELDVNEIHQIGSRVAKACGVDRLYGLDERFEHDVRPQL